jgi:antirestriction protein
MTNLTRRSFASRAFAGIAAFGMVSRANQPAEAQLVWNTSQWNLGSFDELLHEKARVKQLFDITQVEDGASLAKVRQLINHYTLFADPETIVRDMLAHTIPDVMVVASMVSAIAHLQCEGGYTYVMV